MKPVPLEVDDVDEDKLGQGVYVPVPKEFRDQLVGLSVDKLIDDICGLRRVAEVQVLDVGVKVLLSSLLEILFESKICWKKNKCDSSRFLWDSINARWQSTDDIDEIALSHFRDKGWAIETGLSSWTSSVTLSWWLRIKNIFIAWIVTNMKLHFFFRFGFVNTQYSNQYSKVFQLDTSNGWF